MARTVLVADDSPVIQNKAKGILTGEGFDVVTVSNGVAAIKKLAQVNPLVVLADVSMPGKDGYEVCDFVKNSPGLRHVPVLLVVSDMEDYNEQRAAEVRADGYISKKATRTPFDPQGLIATVCKFVAQCEAATPTVEIPRPVIVAPPPAKVFDLGPEEPASRARSSVDLGALSGEIAFAEPEAESAAPWSDPQSEAPPAAETPSHAEPVLIDEPHIAAPAPAVVAPGQPAATERTMMFRPAEIAQPVLKDDLAPAPSEPELPPQGSEPETPPVAATSLESFSLREATAGQVRFASHEPEIAAPETEPATESGAGPLPESAAETPYAAEEEIEAESRVESFEPTPEPAAVAPETEAAELLPESLAEAAAPTSPGPAIDVEFVYKIVNKVVTKTSPAAIPLHAIEEMVNNLVEEIVAELKAELSSAPQAEIKER